MTKPLVIYHADCTDGFGAAFAAWLKLGDGAEYLPMQYGDVSLNHPFDLREMTLDREVYILDFSFIRPVMEQIFNEAKRVVWLDHHKTAFEMWCLTGEQLLWEEHLTHRWITLNNSKSGALLAWEYFHPGTEVPMLIRHIDDRDRWQFKLEGSKELHAALASYKPWSFEQWKTLYSNYARYDGATAVDFLIEEGTAILRAQDVAVQSMMKQARKCEMWVPFIGDPVFLRQQGIEFRNDLNQCYAPHRGLACNASLHISELGHALATQSGTYALIWYVGQDTCVKCSLRSNGDYDVSAIAKAFGGGGHRNAAGFETDIDTLMGWLK